MNPIVTPIVRAPAARTGVRVPRQLPAGTHRVWVDRADELARLQGLRSRPGPIHVVLTGMPGVGKTALALRWLLAQRPVFPDGELYADLGGGPDQPPPKPEQVLAAWLRALGVPAEDMPHERGELAALFRTMAADRALLILADNARTADQVRPLLPASPRSDVLVTSRHRLPELTMDGCEHIHLNSLSIQDGAALLAGVLPSHHRADTAALTALADHCRGLPLALALAGGHLTLRHHHTPADLLARLDTHPHHVLGLGLGEQTVGAMLDMIHRELDPHLAQLLRLCALHPGREFTAPPVAAAWVRTESDTERALARLLDANLLVEASPHRYRLHDLEHDYAGTHADDEDDPDDRDDAVRRMIQWYLRRTAYADLALNPFAPRFGTVFTIISRTSAPRPPFAAPSEAMDWFEAERATILACLHRAAAKGWLTVVAQLGEALWNPMRLTATAADLLDTQRRAATAAAQCTDPGLEALCWVRAAYAETNLDRHGIAVATATTALDRAEQAGNRFVQCVALETRARARLAADDPHTALEDLTRSLAITKTLDNPDRGIALRERLCGRIHAHPDIADFPRAVEHFRTAAQLALVAGDTINHARSIVDLASALVRTNQAQAALQELEHVAPTVRDYGSISYLVDWDVAAGDAHAGLENPAAARDHYRAAASLLESAGRGATRQHTEIGARLVALPPADPARTESHGVHARTESANGPAGTTGNGAAD